MRRALALSLLCFTACALPSLGLAAPGSRLSWDHCAVDGLVAHKSFACDTNLGADVLVASYVPAVAIAQVSGIEAVIHLSATDAALPPWWDFKNAGSCRETSLQHVLTAPPGQSACVDPYDGQAAGGIGSYGVGWVYGPSTARFVVLVAVLQPAVFSVEPGTEYFAFGVSIDHARTVGDPACGGCPTTTCIGISTLGLRTVDGSGEVVMLGTNASAVNWQGGRVSFGVTFERTGYYTSMNCLSATPVHRNTWGAVKSLFR